MGRSDASVVTRAAEKLRSRVVEQLSSDLGADETAQDLSNEEARAAVQELGGAEGVRFRIDCVRPEDKAGTVDYVTASDLDPVALGQRFGPGDYRVRGIAADGTFVKGTTGRFRVSTLVKRDVPERAAAGGGASSVVRELMEYQARQADSTRNFWSALAPALATVLAAWVGRRPDVDIVAFMAAMNSGRGGNDELLKAIVLDRIRAKDGNGLETLEAAFKIAERLSDNGGGDDSIWGTLKGLVAGVAPAAAAALTARRAGQGSPIAAGPASPASPVAQAALPPKPIVLPPKTASSSPIPPSVAGSALFSPPLPAASSAQPAPQPLQQPLGDSPSSTEGAAPVLPHEEMLLKIATPWLRLQAANLEAWASADMDPALASETLTESIPAIFREHVAPQQHLEWLGRQDWWQQLTQFHPPLIAHERWCQRVRTHLIEYFERAAEAEAEDDPKEEVSA